MPSDEIESQSQDLETQIELKFADQSIRLDPKSVIIPPHRQRSDDDIDENFLASIRATNGPFTPIIIKFNENNQPVLIAGKRRLSASLRLEIPQIKAIPFETLDPLSAQIIEYEENRKRKDLPWKDQVKAIGNLHNAFVERNKTWNIAKTAKALNYSDQTYVGEILNVFAHIDSPRLISAANLSQAMGILRRFAERRTAAVVNEIVAAGASIFSQTPVSQLPSHLQPLKPPKPDEDKLPGEDELTDGIEDLASAPAPASALLPATPSLPTPPLIKQSLDHPSIIQANFLEWAGAYSGLPFNFIHCDFPYGVNTEDSLTETYENNRKIYWPLVDCLCSNINRLMSHSAHLMFWLSMRRDLYDQTKLMLTKAGLHVIDRPLIWFKSDMRGAAPGLRGTQPRHTYEVAFLCLRGNRPLVKQMGDGYSAPSVTANIIHPTQKPESMLKYFFTGLVDETTDMLDPTAGSGAAIRAAEELGAKSVLGLELDEGYCTAANAATIRARVLRTAIRGPGSSASASAAN